MIEYIHYSTVLYVCNQSLIYVNLYVVNGYFTVNIMAWNQRHHDCTNEYPVYIRVYDVQWQIILCRVIKIYTMIYFYALCCPCFKRRCCCTSRILVKATSPVSRLVDCVMENCCLEMELVEFCSLRLHWNSRVFPKQCEPVVIMRSFFVEFVDFDECCVPTC